MNKKINTLYFSATGTTRKIITGIANTISEITEGATINTIDITLPEARKKAPAFTEDDVVIVGIPVIAGRVPNVLLQFLNSIKGNDTLAIAVVVYGNRNYDDALIELTDILESNGFRVIAGAAFIGEHSFSKILAQNRPDEKDMALASDFARLIYNKLTSQNSRSSVTVKGNRPYREYYRPKDKNNNYYDFHKIIPTTNREDCIDCKLCAEVCPMGSIDYEDVSKLTGICIKCCACVKNCPTESKYFDDENFLKHKHELEIDFVARREPELFI